MLWVKDLGLSRCPTSSRINHINHAVCWVLKGPLRVESSAGSYCLFLGLGDTGETMQGNFLAWVQLLRSDVLDLGLVGQASYFTLRERRLLGWTVSYAWYLQAVKQLNMAWGREFRTTRAIPHVERTLFVLLVQLRLLLCNSCLACRHRRRHHHQQHHYQPPSPPHHHHHR